MEARLVLWQPPGAWMRHVAILLLVRSVRGPTQSLRSRTAVRITSENEACQAVDQMRGCLEHLHGHLGAHPAKAVSSREASSNRSRVAAVSPALGCDADTYVWIDWSTRLAEPPLLSCECAVMRQARPTPSPRSPLATVRRRGLVVKSCPSGSLQAAVVVVDNW